MIYFQSTRVPSIVLACGALLSICPTTRAAPEIAGTSDGFVDTIGVNIHSTHYLGFPSTTYDNWNGVINATSVLGIRNVRDHVIAPTLLNQLTAATGARVDGILESHYIMNGHLVLDPNSVATQIGYAKQVVGLNAIEGPNEYNEYNDPNFLTTLYNYQAGLYTAAKADPVLAGHPVIGPSLDNPALYASFGNLAAFVDKGNIHSYPPSGNIPTAALNYWLGDVAQMVGSKTVWSTETGYHSSTQLNTPYDVSQAAAAKYMPRLLMEYYKAGIEKTYLYELADDNVDPTNSNGENNLGLVNTDFSLKPAGSAVKNLIALLSDRGQTFAPASLNYTLAGGNSSLHHILLQKGSGKFYLALWQDVAVFDKPSNTDLFNPDLLVTLTFASPILGMTTYLPDGSANPVATYGMLTQVNLNVPDQVLLLEITPMPEPVSALVVFGAALTLMNRRRMRTQCRKNFLCDGL